MIRAALLGAILVHPLLVLWCFFGGMVFGANANFGGGPGPAYQFGWQGGLVGLEGLLYSYLITMGLFPLMASVAGAGLSVGLCLLVRLLRVPNRANSQVAWGAAGALIGAQSGTAVAMFMLGGFDEWTIAISAGAVGVFVAGVLYGMGSSLPRTLGGGLGGIAGGCCVQGGPGPVQLVISVFACGLVAVLVGAVVGELGKLFAAKQVNPED